MNQERLLHEKVLKKVSQLWHSSKEPLMLLKDAAKDQITIQRPSMISETHRHWLKFSSTTFLRCTIRKLLSQTQSEP
ncbi:hypothetical protein FGO68_gene8420 [Halteria grandinella]|uniref:Uncharacterized protein n=1 Tax=Halteria grandinella TaxID=5974 RepID=A0A8J8T2V1_HALGN|nr:hypothetical protein FGO68_gene8420 [Halteria grandinella]